MVDEQITESPIGWVNRHVQQYLETDGVKGHHFHGYDALLLTTRGRKSGVLRRTALYYGNGWPELSGPTPIRVGRSRACAQP